jgi:hypothetical protein
MLVLLILVFIWIINKAMVWIDFENRISWPLWNDQNSTSCSNTWLTSEQAKKAASNPAECLKPHVLQMRHWFWHV